LDKGSILQYKNCSYLCSCTLRNFGRPLLARGAISKFSKWTTYKKSHKCWEKVIM